MARLEKNKILKTTDGDEIKVLEFLGEGGQGAVYKVSYKNGEYALKWYFKGAGKTPEKFYKNLKKNVEKGAPAETFLWPLAITEMDSSKCFGYVMDLRPKEYKEFPLFLNAREKFSGFHAIINAALQISTSFRLLHSKGLSYQDLNDGNFFINPTTGDILICDNDNVTPNNENLGIMGKPGYMAPEILNPDMDNLPDKYSDRFSLAVVLFLLLFRDHPLKGQREDPDDPTGENEMDLMCKNPVFIFDEKDASNRPKPEVHRNAERFWKIYPPFIHAVFRKAFDKSCMNSDGDGKEDRPMEKDWCEEFAHLRNSLIICPECGKETFFPMKNQTSKCMCCKKTISRPPALLIEGKTIPLQEGLKIYSYDIDIWQDFNFESIKKEIGIVVENKNKKGIYGIKNLSEFAWYRKTPGGKEETIMPNSGVIIARDNIVKFGTLCEGTINA